MLEDSDEHIKNGKPKTEPHSLHYSFNPQKQGQLKHFIIWFLEMTLMGILGMPTECLLN